MVSAFKAATTFATSANVSTTFDITTPSVADGDFMVLVVFVPSVTSTLVSCPGFSGINHGLVGSAYSTWTAVSTASSEPAVQTVTLGAAKQNVLAVLATFDKNSLTGTLPTDWPDSAETPYGGGTTPFAIPAFTNSTSNRLGLMMLPVAHAPSVDTPVEYTGLDYVQLHTPIGAYDGVDSPGEGNVRGSLVLCEQYSSTDFAADTWDTVPSGLTSGYRAYYPIGVGYTPPPPSYNKNRFGGDALKLLLRRFNDTALPYDLRNIRLGGEG